MPAQFDNYRPEVRKLMCDAYWKASPQLANFPKMNPLLLRELLASAIIDAFNAGVVDPGELIDAAVATLRTVTTVGKCRSPSC